MIRRFIMCFLLAAPLAATSRVEIRNGRFYVDDEPFYMRGIGYAPWRPHQRPGVSYIDTNRRWTQMDFERMRAANFNTVRTWDALSAEELALARQNGLMVLQGIRLDLAQDFSNPHNQASAVALVERVAEQSKDADNVLGYLLVSDLPPATVLETGSGEMLQLLRRLKRAIQTIDSRPVSIASWLPLAFLDHQDFDFAAFNAYPFWPRSVNHALGYAGYTRWLVDRFGTSRPFILTETGGYAVSQASVTASGGLGGFSEYDQSVKNMESLRAAVEGHSAGTSLVSWIDSWYRPRDPDRHDNEPWEWTGILGIPTNRRKDMDGIPRIGYGHMQRYNEVILLEPKENHAYDLGASIPIQTYGADYITTVRYSLNDGDWLPLNASGKGWFQGFFRLPKLARRRQKLAVQALDAQGTEMARTQVSFLAAVAPERIAVRAAGQAKGLTFTVQVLDGQKRPLAQRKVEYGFFYPVTLREVQGVTTTDAKGEATITCPVRPKPFDRYLYVAAGTAGPDRVRVGDMQIFEVTK